MRPSKILSPRKSHEEEWIREKPGLGRAGGILLQLLFTRHLRVTFTTVLDILFISSEDLDEQSAFSIIVGMSHWIST